jgi:hypothetical protein
MLGSNKAVVLKAEQDRTRLRGLAEVSPSASKCTGLCLLAICREPQLLNQASRMRSNCKSAVLWTSACAAFAEFRRPVSGTLPCTPRLVRPAARDYHPIRREA